MSSMSERRRDQGADDDDRPRFDISWLSTPSSRDDSPPPGGDDIKPPPPQRGVGAEPPPLQPLREQELDDRLIGTLAERRESHIVDLAAELGVEFEDALRSVLRLAARRMIVIEQRDPIANDHLVARAARARR
jgi:hypothetical protein